MWRKAKGSQYPVAGSLKRQAQPVLLAQPEALPKPAGDPLDVMTRLMALQMMQQIQRENAAASRQLPAASEDRWAR